MPISKRIDNLLIGAKNDGRRRITDEQRQQIVKLYQLEQESINRIAKITGVSKRSVQFILFPERLEVVKARAIETKRWEAYNTKDIRLEVMRKHRAKKKQLLEAGKISFPELSPQ